MGFVLAYTYLSAGAEDAANKTNEVQALSESSALGIPTVFSMDSVIGASWVDGASLLPDQLTLAATGDVELVRELTDMQREEMLALGVRMSLSPVADLATDPRWGRVQECFGEDVELATQMVVAAIEGLQIILAGSLAEDTNALSSGWKIENYTAKSIRTAIEERAGAENVTYIADDVSQVQDSYPEGTTAIVVVGEASGTHEPAWGTATLEFPAEQADMVAALKASGVPVVTVVIMNRAYVLTDIAENSDAVMLAYRPGATAGADAIAGALFGETAITGKTPFQIPASMDQVLLQREDLAKDIEDPLYDYGYGIDVESFGA